MRERIPNPGHPTPRRAAAVRPPANPAPVVGNRAMVDFFEGIQRAPSKWDPASYSTYGAWLQALPAGAIDENAIDITGQAAAELPVLADLITSLRADCADVGIILRHFWLKGHGKSGVIHGRDPRDPKKPKRWKIGAGVSKKQLRLVVVYIGTSHFQTGQSSRRRQLDWHGGTTPYLNLKKIIDAGLAPGHILMWKKNRGVRGNFSGHFQTVQRINGGPLAPGLQGPPAPRSIDVLQGTMYEGVRAGQLQAKRLSFELLTGKADGDGPVTHQPGNEEHFVGAGTWR